MIDPLDLQQFHGFPHIGGGAFLAEQPQDILNVLATSLLTRD